MRAVALVLLLAFTVQAAEPDVPRAGETTVTLSEKELDLLTTRLARFEAEAATCKAEVKNAPILPVWASIVIGVVAVGAGVAVGYGVARAVPRP